MGARTRHHSHLKRGRGLLSRAGCAAACSGHRRGRGTHSGSGFPGGTATAGRGKACSQAEGRRSDRMGKARTSDTVHSCDSGYCLLKMNAAH